MGKTPRKSDLEESRRRAACSSAARGAEGERGRSMCVLIASRASRRLRRSAAASEKRPSPPPGGFAWTLQNLTAADKTQGVTSFRLSDAFDKWERVSELMQQLHQDARQITAQLCAYLPRDSPEAVHKASEIRRLIMLGCTLMIHEDSRARGEIRPRVRGVITRTAPHHGASGVEEGDHGRVGAGGRRKKRQISEQESTGVCVSGDQEALTLNHELLRDGLYLCPHTWSAIDEEINRMANTYEKFEHIGTTLLPLPYGYAQLTRFIGKESRH